MLDGDFKIERPKRYYRQGLNLLHSDAVHANNEYLSARAQEKLLVHSDSERRSMIGSIRSRVSKIFHIEPRHPRAETANGIPVSGDEDSDSSRASSASSNGSRPPTPMLDPSTNANPLSGDSEHPNDEKNTGKKGQKIVKDVSKHTFYIVNSQMRLKLFARNEVS